MRNRQNFHQRVRKTVRTSAHQRRGCAAVVRIRQNFCAPSMKPISAAPTAALPAMNAELRVLSVPKVPAAAPEAITFQMSALPSKPPKLRADADAASPVACASGVPREPN